MSGLKPEIDHNAAVAALRAQGADDDTVHRFLTETLGMEEVPAAGPSPTQTMVRQALKTPAGKARLEQGNREQFEAEMPTLLDYPKAIAGGVAAEGAALGRDIPGVEALQAGARKLVRGGTYAGNLDEIRGAEDELPAAARIPARMLGAGVSMAALPGSTAMQGARYGVLKGLAQANPDAGAGERLKNAALEGTMGLVAGKGADYASTALKGAKAAITGATPAARVLVRQEARTIASKPGYDAFRDLGDLAGTADAQPLTDMIEQLPIIRRAVDSVKGESPRLARLPDTHAEVVDAAYKLVGNKAWRATQGFTKDEARQGFADAIEQAAHAKGGSYQKALAPYREASKGIQAVQRGEMTLRAAARPTGTPTNRAADFGPESFGAFAKRATPDEQAGAAEGILGELSRRPILARVGGLRASTSVPLPFPSKFTREANSLLEQVQPDSPFTRLLKSIAASTATPNP